MIRSALSATLDVHATAANQNNQIGVPQTLLALPESADIAVLEVGTNQPGEIALLREIVQANIAVITMTVNLVTDVLYTLVDPRVVLK